MKKTQSPTSDLAEATVMFAQILEANMKVAKIRYLAGLDTWSEKGESEQSAQREYARRLNLLRQDFAPLIEAEVDAELKTRIAAIRERGFSTEITYDDEEDRFHVTCSCGFTYGGAFTNAFARSVSEAHLSGHDAA